MDKVTDEQEKSFDDLTDVIEFGTRLSKWKAPKSGGMFGKKIQGQRFCKGICGRFSEGRPTGPAYKSHYLCRSCGNDNYGIWFKHKDAVISKLGQIRCPCCNVRVKTHSAKSKYQLTKKPNP